MSAARAGLIALLVAIGVFGAQGFLQEQIPRGHDLAHHLWGLYGAACTILDGDFVPRWIPYLGPGMPLPSFYCPIGTLAGGHLGAAGVSPETTLRLLLVVAQVASALSAFFAVRLLGGSSLGGVVAAAAFVLAPYHLFNQNVRVALAECLAMPVAPLLLAAGRRCSLPDPPARAKVVLAVSAVVLLGLHVLSVLALGFTMLALIVPALVLVKSGDRVKALGSLAVPTLVAVAFTTAWWLPVLIEGPLTGIGTLVTEGYEMREFALALDEPLRRRPWGAFAVRPPWSASGAPWQALSIYFGCGLAVALGLGALRPGGRLPAARDPRPWAVIGVLLVLLTTRPFAPLLEVVRLELLQFPWRLLGPASACAAVSAGLAVDAWRPRLPARALSAASALLITLLAFDALPYLTAPETVPPLVDGAVRHGTRPEAPPFVVPPPERPGDLVRIEGWALPPADHATRVGMVRRVFPQILPRKLTLDFARYWVLAPEDRAQSEMLGVAWRFTGADAPTPLRPGPFAALLSNGGDVAPLDWERTPTRIIVDLPAASPGGRVRLAESWFVGWRVRIDRGPWMDPTPPGLILTTEVPPGAHEVEFRYAWLYPRHRAVGLGVSGLTFLGLLGFGVSLRRRRP